jgi:hypothetical protein
VTTVVDLWRWLDPAARLVSGDPERLVRPVRGVARTRAAPPHLPPIAEGRLLILDAPVLPDTRLDPLLTAIAEAGLDPAAVWIAGVADRRFETASAALPVLTSEDPGSETERRAMAHLEHERQDLASLAASLRLAGAEAALADPQPSAPAGLVATRLRRGVAVSIGGEMVALHARPAGRALASRFAAVHGRLPSRRAAPAEARRHTSGLWILERSVAAGDVAATAWLFDDLPFARLDEVALDALTTTLRALLRRRPAVAGDRGSARRMPPSTGDPLRDTLLAVARANGRVAPAARALGVHRNTVLYRLRRAAAELGIDPRRPEDAIRLLERSEDP